MPDATFLGIATRKEDRRGKLYPLDSMAMQLLEPYGDSVVDSLSMPKLWESVSKVNNKAKYHNHLCADSKDHFLGRGDLTV